MDNRGKLGWWERGYGYAFIIIVDIVALLSYVAGFALLGIYSNDWMMTLATPIGLLFACIGSAISACNFAQIRNAESILIACNEMKLKIQDADKQKFLSQNAQEQITNIDNQFVAEYCQNFKLDVLEKASFGKWATAFLSFSIPSFGLLTGLTANGIIFKLGFHDLYSIAQVTSLVAVLASSAAAFKVGATFIKNRVQTHNKMIEDDLPDLCKELCIGVIKLQQLYKFLNAKLKVIQQENCSIEIYKKLLIDEINHSLVTSYHDNDSKTWSKKIALFIGGAFGDFEHNDQYKAIYDTEAKLQKQFNVKYAALQNAHEQEISELRKKLCSSGIISYNDGICHEHNIEHNHGNTNDVVIIGTGNINEVYL